MFYSITNFFNKYQSLHWLFGFIISFIVLIIFFYFIDYLIKYQKKHNLNFFKIVKIKKSQEKDIKINIQSDKDSEFKKVRKPSRSRQINFEEK